MLIVITYFANVRDKKKFNMVMIIILFNMMCKMWVRLFLKLNWCMSFIEIFLIKNNFHNIANWQSNIPIIHFVEFCFNYLLIIKDVLFIIDQILMKDNGSELLCRWKNYEDRSSLPIRMKIIRHKNKVGLRKILKNNLKFS